MLENLLPCMNYPDDDETTPDERHQLTDAFATLIVGYGKMYEKEDDESSKKMIIAKRMNYESTYANLTKGELEMSD